MSDARADKKFEISDKISGSPGVVKLGNGYDSVNSEPRDSSAIDNIDIYTSGIQNEVTVYCATSHEDMIKYMDATTAITAAGLTTSLSASAEFIGNVQFSEMNTCIVIEAKFFDTQQLSNPSISENISENYKSVSEFWNACGDSVIHQVDEGAAYYYCLVYNTQSSSEQQALYTSLGLQLGKNQGVVGINLSNKLSSTKTSFYISQNQFGSLLVLPNQMDFNAVMDFANSYASKVQSGYAKYILNFSTKSYKTVRNSSSLPDEVRKMIENAEFLVPINLSMWARDESVSASQSKCRSALSRINVIKNINTHYFSSDLNNDDKFKAYEENVVKTITQANAMFTTFSQGTVGALTADYSINSSTINSLEPDQKATFSVNFDILNTYMNLAYDVEYRKFTKTGDENLAKKVESTEFYDNKTYVSNNQFGNISIIIESSIFMRHVQIGANGKTEKGGKYGGVLGFNFMFDAFGPNAKIANQSYITTSSNYKYYYQNTCNVEKDDPSYPLHKIINMQAYVGDRDEVQYIYITSNLDGEYGNHAEGGGDASGYTRIDWEFKDWYPIGFAWNYSNGNEINSLVICSIRMKPPIQSLSQRAPLNASTKTN